MIPLVTLWWMVGLTVSAGAAGWALGGPVASAASAGAVAAVEGLFLDVAGPVLAKRARRAAEQEERADDGSAG